MIDIMSLIQLPFIQRAVLAGILLSVLASVMGVITLIRKASFYGDAIAHSSLAGVALGLWLGWYPLATAMGYAVCIALLLPWLKKTFRLPLDNLLGILLPSSMGLGVLIFSLLPGFQPEMMSYLFGNIITIRQTDLWIVIGLFFISVSIFSLYLPRLLFLSLDEEYASLLKMRSTWLERVYEVLLAITVIAGVKLLGVVLINALLIIPASTAKMVSRSLYSWIWITVGLNMIIVIGGLLLSLVINVPPGATIAVFAGTLFLFISLLFGPHNNR